MPSIHRKKGSPFWHCAFYLSDGRRTLRSTGTRNKKKAMGVCLEFAKAADLGREGRLTEARAREAIADIYALANREQMPSATVSDFLKGWITRKQLEVSDSSAGEYERIANDFIKAVGAKADRHIDAITIRDISDYRDKLAAHLSGGTVNKILKVLRSAWQTALKDGLIQENVFVRLDFVKVRRSKRRAFTLDEVKQILGSCSGEWRGMVLIGFYTGQRLGDIAGLTWQNVDLQNEEIRFVTRKTERTMAIPIPAPLLRYLLTLPAPDKPDAYLFPKMAQSRTSTLSQQFSDLLGNLGLIEKKTHQSAEKGRRNKRAIHEVSFHCLRHTTTSMLKNEGVSNAIAMELIGHDSEAVSRTYTHIEKKTLQKAVSKLPDIV